MRADLSAERPPPLGDVVGAAIRDGRRLRRNRRLGTFGAGVAAAGVLAAAAVVLLGDGGMAARPGPAVPAAGPAGAAAAPQSMLPPGSVPTPVPATPATPPARTLTIHSGTERAVGLQKKATSAAMLHLLTQLLPPGRTSHYAVGPDDDLQVQLYLDDGNGPALVRVAVDMIPPSVTFAPEPSPRAATMVTIQYMPDNCLQNMTVAALWPDGTQVQVDVATCLGAPTLPTLPALTSAQAVKIASDPRWGATMDAKLVASGTRQFPKPLPVVAR
jgi:hypothetical protein